MKKFALALIAVLALGSVADAQNYRQRTVIRESGGFRGGFRGPLIAQPFGYGGVYGVGVPFGGVVSFGSYGYGGYSTGVYGVTPPFVTSLPVPVSQPPLRTTTTTTVTTYDYPPQP